ncbi:MAG: hypothetical protein HJJLKODD_02615 [Phycisphaerae bacterium]|nr:hypothetical protein [Phycisphaerae bacterium]
MSIMRRLEELQLAIPVMVPPVGSYIPAIRVGELIHTSGQLPAVDGKLIAIGKVPGECSLEQAQKAAQVAVLNALAAIHSAIGSIETIQRIVRLGVFVNSSAGFYDQAKVANGASDLLVQIWDESGKHVRAAVGVAELPLNAAVELELTVLVRS